MTDQQIISLAGANITAVGSTTTTGYENPGNIIDKDSGIDGADNTWLLEDDSSGSWTATSGFSFFVSRYQRQTSQREIWDLGSKIPKPFHPKIEYQLINLLRKYTDKRC